MWPLGPGHERLLHELGALIAKDGPWRFMHGHVVAANNRDYPDVFEENRAGVARALARTAWHARVDLQLVLDDQRKPGEKSEALVRKSGIELVEVSGGRARFVVTAIGNDDIAGILATEVGRAFLAQLAERGDPMRSGPADSLPDASSGTLAAVYLGLGVVAANASRYARSIVAVEGRGRHEHEIDHIGGLTPEEVAFLVAVQATVRDDVPPALDTLAKSHAKAVAGWREALDGHEDELRALLELGTDTGADSPAPPRPNAPPSVHVDAVWSESDLPKTNVGRRVYRYRETKAWTTTPLATLAGVGVGLPLLMVAGAVVPILVAPSAGFVGGLLYGLRQKQLRCSACGCFLEPTDTDCRRCGGTIVGDVNSVDEARDREEAYEDEMRAVKRDATE